MTCTLDITHDRELYFSPKKTIPPLPPKSSGYTLCSLFLKKGWLLRSAHVASSGEGGFNPSSSQSSVVTKLISLSNYPECSLKYLKVCISIRAQDNWYKIEGQHMALVSPQWTVPYVAGSTKNNFTNTGNHLPGFKSYYIFTELFMFRASMLGGYVLECPWFSWLAQSSEKHKNKCAEGLLGARTDQRLAT